MSPMEHAKQTGAETESAGEIQPFKIRRVNPPFCDPGYHHPDVACPVCGTGHYADDAADRSIIQEAP
ncbi:hypothetical protein [Methylomonas sp. UP202]|uniref:hypothetical protein n=1 Tax=Methylomonas sp. UP202 TaxID=3040943 RepID=UPI002478B355|nr:hypothetical protein [Methylomonas sp. UP202]WGS83928.1 hypothetical protein QC632_12760 [Methylomonas sp. UP202]